MLEMSVCAWFEHDLFRKPVPTFRDHALEHFAAATAALEPGDGRAGLWQSIGALTTVGSRGSSPATRRHHITNYLSTRPVGKPCAVGREPDSAHVFTALPPPRRGGT